MLRHLGPLPAGSAPAPSARWPPGYPVVAIVVCADVTRCPVTRLGPVRWLW